MAKKYQVGAHGTTAAVATGTAIAHNCPSVPTAVLVTPVDTGLTDIYVDTIGAANFTIHYAGGGVHAFNWVALVL